MFVAFEINLAVAPLVTAAAMTTEVSSTVRYRELGVTGLNFLMPI
jgi:hypothetical protein